MLGLYSRDGRLGGRFGDWGPDHTGAFVCSATPGIAGHVAEILTVNAAMDRLGRCAVARLVLCYDDHVTGFFVLPTCTSHPRYTVSEESVAPVAHEEMPVAPEIRYVSSEDLAREPWQPTRLDGEC